MQKHSINGNLWISVAIAPYALLIGTSKVYSVRVLSGVDQGRGMSVDLVVVADRGCVSQVLLMDESAKLVGFTARRATEMFAVAETSDELKLNRRSRESLLIQIRTIVQTEIMQRDMKATGTA